MLFEQYHVYLFETILLCCKDIDLSKPKNKLSSKNLVDKASGKPKLQLKGRIFMQNVTDLVSLAKPGTYADQEYLSIRSSEKVRPLRQLTETDLYPQSLGTVRLIHLPDLLERRPVDREFHHPVCQRGRDEEVGDAD